MAPLSAVADAYDAWMKEVYDDLDEMYYWSNNEVARQHGANSLQSNTWLVMSTTLYGLYMASQIVGQGFVDKLRVGESLNNPTAGNIAQDALRLLSLASPAYRVARFGGAVISASGKYLMSCGVTSTAIAANLSGVRLGLRLKDFQIKAKLPMSPKDPKFAGVKPRQIVAVLKDLGAKTIDRAVTDWADLKRMIDLNRGPVIFGYEGIERGKFIRHIMTGFRVGGKTLFADQNGIFAEATIQAKFVGPARKLLFGMIVEDSAFVPAIDYASSAAAELNIAATEVSHFFDEEDDFNFIAENLLIPAWIIPGKVLWGLGDLINERLGRQPRSKEEGLSIDATKVLRVTPSGAGKNALLVQVGSGLSTDAFLAAVDELEAKGRVHVVRSTSTPLGLVNITRIK